MRPFLISGLTLLLGSVTSLVAQDVEVLGEVYGTRPPAGYFRQMQADPGSFRFEQEGLERLSLLRQSSAPGLDGAGALSAPAGTGLGPRPPLLGTFRLPMVLGVFSDGPPEPPFSREQIQNEFFDGPNSRYQTLTEFYSEVSGGRLDLEGVVFDWVQTGLTRLEVTQNQSGLVSHPTHGIGAYVERLVQALDEQGVDWSRFDRSGDGFVDIFAVMHPYAGAECSGGAADRIWSHRWSLRSATQGRLDPGFRTSTPRPGGGGEYIYVNDYTVQPALSCDAEELNEIGVFAHELGHAFGLPDLYATGGHAHAGAGSWDLMGTGSWGCQGGGSPARPCHMGAWTKSVLGWLDIEDVERNDDRAVTLPPVQDGNRVLKIPTRDGAQEYLLLENRQRMGSDVLLFEPGLLIWHVDETLVEATWSGNSINTNPAQMGVWLRQADGQNHLATPSSGRGDPGDPFPGCIKPSILQSPPTLGDYADPSIPCSYNRTFRIDSKPGALTHAGRAFGVALTDIELVGPEPHDVRFRLDTRFAWDTVHVAATAEAVKPQDLVLGVQGLPDPLTWRLVGGTIPPGLTFDAGNGRLRGMTFEVGAFEFAMSAADGLSRELHVVVSLDVLPPIVPREDLVASFLGRPDPLSQDLRVFLDRHGNQSGSFDLGDARAYMQANPHLPERGSGPAEVPAVVPLRSDPWIRGQP